MAKKAQKVSKEPVQHYCGDCGRGEWIEKHSNKDWEGKYICLRCPFHKWARIRTEKACDKWIPKTKEI